MFLTDLSIKRPVIASVMSLVLVIFGSLVFFDIPTNEIPDIDRPVVSIQTDYKGASANVVDKTNYYKKIEDFVGGTAGLVSIESMSEDERSRIDMTFKDNLDIDDVANDVRSAISRVVDNLPKEASAPEIFKQSAGFRTTMWLSFSSDFMSDLELTDFKVRILSSEKGTDAIVRVIIESKDKEGNFWTTVGVSTNIIDASYNALRESLIFKLIKTS